MQRRLWNKLVVSVMVLRIGDAARGVATGPCQGEGTCSEGASLGATVGLPEPAWTVYSFLMGSAEPL